MRHFSSSQFRQLFLMVMVCLSLGSESLSSGSYSGVAGAGVVGVVGVGVSGQSIRISVE